jgi:hypothetical protein
MAGHNLNDASSRSHVLVRVAVSSSLLAFPEESRTSTLTVVDLAGFERQKQTGTTSDSKTYAESIAINKSLMTLRQVITALAKGGGHHHQRASPAKSAGSSQRTTKHLPSSRSSSSRLPSVINRQHVPFRDSKLTSLLKDSLGGSSRLTLIACIHNRPEFADDNLSTLHYASMVCAS